MFAVAVPQKQRIEASDTRDIGKRSPTSEAANVSAKPAQLAAASSGETPGGRAPNRLSWDLSTIPTFAADVPSRHRPLQAKLMIGSVSDPLETEADRIADRVTETQTAPPPAQPAPVQLQRKCNACAREDDETVRLKPASNTVASAATAPPIVAATLARPGQAMDPATRSFFEPRLGRSLADVRIHSDASAAHSAEAISARAYAVGTDIVFAPGQYSPGTLDGRRLLAHELAHVVQQSGGSTGSAPGPLVVRRQSTEGKLTPATPAPAPGVNPPQPAPPTNAPVAGADPAEGKLGPPEQPSERLVQLMIFDCSQKLLVVEAGPVRQSYKLEVCSLPPGSYEPTVEHLGNDFQLHFGRTTSNKERFDFSYYVKPGQPNPAILLAKQDKVDVEVVDRLPAPSGKRAKPQQIPPQPEHKTPPAPPCVVHLADRQLVDPDSGSRALFKPLELNQTVWSHPIPLGQFGFVDVDANVTGSLSGTLSGRYGPGSLTGICLTHQIDTASSSAPTNHPIVKSTGKADPSTFIVGGRARFRLPASASVVIIGKAALVIAADYLKVIRVGSLQGGLTARGEASLGGSFDASVEIIAQFTRSSSSPSTPIADLALEIPKASLKKIDLAAQVALHGHSSLSFTLDAFAAATFLGFELWRETWRLKKGAKIGLGWEGGIKYSPNPGIHWLPGILGTLEGIDEALIDDEESHVDPDDVLGTLLDQRNGTQTTPDGLSKQTALPFTWHKPLDIMYPETLDIPNAVEPKVLHRDNGPTTVTRNVNQGGGRSKTEYERIGVAKNNWVGRGKFLQYVPHATESREQQDRLRDLLTELGFDRSETQVDHVLDLQFGGKDEFRNLWPGDSTTNLAAGPKHENQLDNYRQQFAAQNETLEGRIFVISDVEL